MKDKKSNTLIIALVAIVILLAVLLVVVLNNKKEDSSGLNNNSSEVDNGEKPQYEIYPVNNLALKLGKLDFGYKDTTSVSEENLVNAKAKIDNGKVNITLNNVTYTVPNIETALSVGMGLSVQGTGRVETFILTAEGEVYHVIDELSNIKKSDYVGNVKKYDVSIASAIAVVYQNFNQKY